MIGKLDVMIIGVEKAGTSALLKHLGGHPDIAIPGKYVAGQTSYDFEQEFSCFLPDSKLGSLDFQSYFKAEFGEVPESVKLCLAKNVGVCFEIQAMQALKAHNDAAKVIVMLRNPVERAFSSFWYQRYRGAETKSNFLSAIKFELEGGGVARHLSYLKKGLYCEQLLSAYSIFGEDNVFVILSEKMKEEPENELAELLSFVGLPSLQPRAMDRVNESKASRSALLSSYIYKESFIKSFVRKIFSFERRKSILLVLRRFNSKSSVYPRMSLSERALLANYYSADVAKLSRLLRLDLGAYWRDFRGEGHD